MSTENIINENKVENEEDKTSQNNEVGTKSNNKSTFLKTLGYIFLFIVWSIFCLFLRAWSVVAGLPYDSIEFREKAPVLLAVTTFVYYATPIIWIFVPIIVILSIIVKTSDKK